MLKPIATARYAGGCWIVTPGSRWRPTKEERFKFKTRTPWHIISECRALAVDVTYRGNWPTTARIYGYRNLSNPREDGYHLEGRVSLGGKSYTAFTSSMMFCVDPHTSPKHSRRRSGKQAKYDTGDTYTRVSPRLVEVAVLHVRTGRNR